jgi:hypothetical protein
MWAIAILAIVAFLADLVIHIAALLGFNPQDWIQPAWLELSLYYGVFGLLLAIVIVRGNLRERRAKREGLTIEQDDNPLWFKAIVWIVAVYAFITAADVFFRANGGELSHPGPGVYLADPGHGHPVEQITEAQFNHYRRNEVRLVSAFLLIFYLQFAFEFLAAAMGKTWGSRPGEARPTSGGAVWIVWRRSRTWSSKRDILD